MTYKPTARNSMALEFPLPGIPHSHPISCLNLIHSSGCSLVISPLRSFPWPSPSHPTHILLLNPFVVHTCSLPFDLFSSYLPTKLWVLVARDRSILLTTLPSTCTELSPHSTNISERLCLRLSSGRDPTTVSSRDAVPRVMSGERMFRTVLIALQKCPAFSTPRLLRLLLPITPPGASKCKSIHIKILIILSLKKASLPLTPAQQF